jgi:hypothetical protein
VIPLLGASALLVDDAHGLGNVWYMLPHFIIYPLCCQATLIMPNPHGFCCPVADSNTGTLGPDVDMYSRHVDCISIWDDGFRQPEGITLYCRFSMVVNDSISKMYFSLWESPEVSERMWSVNLEASISAEYQTVRG